MLWFAAVHWNFAQNPLGTMDLCANKGKVLRAGFLGCSWLGGRFWSISYFSFFKTFLFSSFYILI
jgi:hypothetical protein